MSDTGLDLEQIAEAPPALLEVWMQDPGWEQMCPGPGLWTNGIDRLITPPRARARIHWSKDKTCPDKPDHTIPFKPMVKNNIKTIDPPLAHEASSSPFQGPKTSFGSVFVV